MRTDGEEKPLLETTQNELLHKAKAGKEASELIGVVEDAMHIGVFFLPSFCAVLLAAYKRNASATEVEKLFDGLMALGIAPTEPMYGVLLDALGRAGLTDRMLERANEARQKFNGRLTIATVNVVLNGLAIAMRTHSATELVAATRADGVKPNVVTYTTLIKMWCAAGNVAMAEEVRIYLCCLVLPFINAHFLLSAVAGSNARTACDAHGHYV